MGIADFAVELPTGQISADEFVRNSGVAADQVARVLPSGKITALAEGESAWHLARDAAVRVLARTPVPAEDIGLVLYAGIGEWDTPLWSPASKIALELGIEHALCFEIQNFCNAGLLAVKLADDQVRAGAVRHALVLMGEPMSRYVAHGRGHSELFNFADYGAAVLVSADAARYEVLGAAHHTEPRWADAYFGTREGGGIATFQRGERLEGLGESFLDNFTTLTRKVLADIGRGIDEVAYVLVTHGNQETHRSFLAAMGVDASRSVFPYDLNGHLGSADPLFDLEELERDGRLTPGDLVIVVTAGSGFTFGVTALERR